MAAARILNDLRSQLSSAGEVINDLVKRNFELEQQLKELQSTKSDKKCSQPT